MQTRRFSGLDLIRTLAIFSVIGGHFFMNTGFQNVEFGGVSMFAQGCAKFFFAIVPLLFACSYATAWLKVKLLRF